MNKTLKLTLIAIGTLSLFACDGGPTTTKSTLAGGNDPGTGVLKTYKINVSTDNLILATNDMLEVSNVTNGDSIQITANDIAVGTPPTYLKTFTTVIDEAKSYTLSVSNKPVAQTCTISSGNATSSDMSADENVTVTCTTDVTSTPLVGVAADGKDYYMSECAVCHKSGTDDMDTTFAGADLAREYQLKTSQDLKDLYIKSDMHAFNAYFMGRFLDVDTQYVANLKAYLETAQLVPTAAQ